MNSIKALTAAIAALFLVLQASSALANDEEHKFSFKGHSSAKITNQQDFATLKASEYASKLGYEFFSVEKVNRYETRTAKGTRRIGSVNPARKNKRTEVTIRVYNSATAGANVLKTSDVSSEINRKYAS